MSLAPFGFGFGGGGGTMGAQQRIPQIWDVLDVYDPYFASQTQAGDSNLTRRTGTRGPRSLRCDVIETPQCISILVELPGVSPENMDISVANDHLVITAKGEEKFIPQLEEDVQCIIHQNERTHRGRLRRSIPIPQGADQARVENQYKNGLLTVTFQKRAGAEGPKKLAVTFA